MIKSFFSDLAFSYFTTNGSGYPERLSNWGSLLPTDLLDKIENYDWRQQPERNYNEIAKLLDVNDDANEKFFDLAHFRFFKSIDHLTWKIADYKRIFPDNYKLYSQIEKTFSAYKIWVTQIRPGCCIPQHIDSVESFLEEFSIDTTEISGIKRLLVLPADIDPWHHLWYGKSIISQGTKGDVYRFDFWEPHGGSNLGPRNKYTIQIMGLLKD